MHKTTERLQQEITALWQAARCTGSGSGASVGKDWARTVEAGADIAAGTNVGDGAGTRGLLLAPASQQAAVLYCAEVQPPPLVTPEVSGVQRTPTGNAGLDLRLLLQQ